MKYGKLGSSKLKVSRVCLGTMTWGKQNDQKDADEQIAYAIDRGINCMDTAEIYSVPPAPDRYGNTEKIIGNWVKNNPSKRKKMIIFSKICGRDVDWIRKGRHITGKAVIKAVEGSLKRLNTDYIDLYQLHWPNREYPHFNKHWFGKADFSTIKEKKEDKNMLGVLQALQKCVKAGKIRYCGLSNESPWGIQKYIQLAREHDLPKMVSLQNEFSLVQTKDWPYVIESCEINDIGYLPWSPLGSGVLSGKYANGKRPKGSRWSFAGRHGIFRDQKMVHDAVKKYVAVAKKHKVTPSQLALMWVDQFPWVSSTIIGATTMKQLKENIDAFDKRVSKAFLEDVDAVLRAYPIPYA